MKKIHFIIYGMLIFSVASAQETFMQRMSDPREDFFKIKSEARTYFDANPDNDLDGTFARFYRWEHFWQTRVSLDPVTNTYNFTRSIDAMQGIWDLGICMQPKTLYFIL